MVVSRLSLAPSLSWNGWVALSQPVYCLRHSVVNVTVNVIVNGSVNGTAISSTITPIDCVGVTGNASEALSLSFPSASTVANVTYTLPRWSAGVHAAQPLRSTPLLDGIP